MVSATQEKIVKIVPQEIVGHAYRRAGMVHVMSRQKAVSIVLQIADLVPIVRMGAAIQGQNHVPIVLKIAEHVLDAAELQLLMQ